MQPATRLDPRLPVRGSVAIAIALLAIACSSGTPAASFSPGTVGILASDYRFDPVEVAVKPGRVTFEVRNGGLLEHEFEILRADGSVLDEIEGLVPGLSRQLSVDLAAGTYVMVCRLNDHEQRGMKGTLTVAP